MSTTQTAPAAAVGLGLDELSGLIGLLEQRGCQVIGPTIRDGAVVYGTIHGVGDLPRGWTTEQSPGRYRLKKRDDEALFGFAAPAFGLKRFLHPPEIRVFRAQRDNGAFRILDDVPEPAPRMAFFGVRACDLAAVARQDRVLLKDRYRDTFYEARRAGVFIVAAACQETSGSCFCASMGTGPVPEAGYDILLRERTGPGVHQISAESGSAEGTEVLALLGGTPCEPPAAAAPVFSRTLETAGLREALYDAFENPRWDQTAARCLACGNCTMACPTCFCVTVEDSSDVTLRNAERWRRWDSCFSQNFSYIHGGSVRLSQKSRYRQWLTHKLAAWQDQFGETGCVGCGRCITWCPAGIDITEEAAAFRSSGTGATVPAGK